MNSWYITVGITTAAFVWGAIAIYNIEREAKEWREAMQRTETEFLMNMWMTRRERNKTTHLVRKQDDNGSNRLQEDMGGC